MLWKELRNCRLTLSKTLLVVVGLPSLRDPIFARWTTTYHSFPRWHNKIRQTVPRASIPGSGLERTGYSHCPVRWRRSVRGREVRGLASHLWGWGISQGQFRALLLHDSLPVLHWETLLTLCLMIRLLASTIHRCVEMEITTPWAERSSRWS